MSGTGVLAGWLHNAVIKIVATYSMPGHRVLLLAPSPDAVSSPRRPGRYAGLFEAAWSVARLGRGIQTAFAAPYVASGESMPPNGLFNVVILAADPQVLTSIRPTRWCRLLVPGGVLAVVTHGRRTMHGFWDPADSLVWAGREDGLKYVDRIGLLQVPVDGAVPGLAEPAVHVRAHADLHVFSADRGGGA
ncbi:hypothetical protein [Kibdelosporangium aridum]|uniref:hypothetical protein n=1 Tax=Kibdelosporangium aridum TaxID=2030 RepID=UPI000A001F53|nr:hypothetical protein [Kibdelosporangium aridum]